MRLDAVVLRDTRSGARDAVRVDRCFYFIGHLPATALFAGQVALTERGYVRTDHRMRTSLEGVFAAGDVRDTCLRQIATAVGDGAIAGAEAQRHLAEREAARHALAPAHPPEPLPTTLPALDLAARVHARDLPGKRP